MEKALTTAIEEALTTAIEEAINVNQSKFHFDEKFKELEKFNNDLIAMGAVNRPRIVSPADMAFRGGSSLSF